MSWYISVCATRDCQICREGFWQHHKHFTTTEKEKLIDLRDDKFYRSAFFEKTLDKFCLYVKTLYPVISLKAVKTLLPFASSWFWEFGVLALIKIKSKKREKLLKVDDELWTCLAIEYNDFYLWAYKLIWRIPRTR